MRHELEERINLRLDARSLTVLRRIADREHRTVSGVVRLAIRRYIETCLPTDKIATDRQEPREYQIGASDVHKS